MSLALSAFVVSLASLWLTLHNARTMERLVAANSYPNVDISFGNEAGKDVALFAWPDAPGDPRWARLDAARKNKNTTIGVRVCYCSVFDECYLHDIAYREPRRVGACPTPAVPYGD